MVVSTTQTIPSNLTFLAFHHSLHRLKPLASPYLPDITNILIFNLNGSYLNITATLTATKDELSIADVMGALIDEEGRQLGSGDQKEKDVNDVVLYA